MNQNAQAHTAAPATVPVAHPVLVLFAHPALERSRVNRAMMEAVRELPGVTFHDLYEEYPDFDIDVRREQELLERHGVVVMHHPLYWYSTPALLKQWQDLVLEHGWAYGKYGKALVGKIMLSAVTTGGSAEAYTHEGFHQRTLIELLAPIRQTARLCGMTYLPPFAAHDAFRVEKAGIEHVAAEYRQTLEALRDGQLDVARALEGSCLNPLVAELAAGGRG